MPSARTTVHALLVWSAFLLIGVVRAHADGQDSVYFANSVKHADGSMCQHLPPVAAFDVFLNRDENRVLTETAPRWNPTGQSNINGFGAFGVELMNFSNSAPAVGDSVFVRFTCSATQQQGILGDSLSSIPWLRFPKILHLSSTTIPDAPQYLSVVRDTITGYRTLRWTGVGGVTYRIYRRDYDDRLPAGTPRMQYMRIADRVLAPPFLDVTAQKAKKYGYILYAVTPTGIVSSHSAEANDDPTVRPGLDLTVGYIARIPRQEYVWGSTNPTSDGWPFAGQSVLWRAHIKNWSDSSLTSVKYVWYLDSAPVDSGFVAMPAGDTVNVDLLWSWSFERHQLKFVIDPDNTVGEEEEGNNGLTIYTDAIGAGFYVEQSVYDYFHQHQKELKVSANCWEDWAQRHVKRWNQMFASAVYAESPNGVLDRIRIDNIAIVPDGALPLAGGLASNNPNLNDRTVDLQWGFAATLLSGSFYGNHTSVNDNNPFYFEGSLLHELGHARYLIDVYGFNVHDTGGNTVAIRENGQLVAGSTYMPRTGDAVYYTPVNGLMNGTYTFVDRYSAPALNLIAGHRAVEGNYNAPDNIGVFMQDLPAQNRLTVKDGAGSPSPYATVSVYQAGPQAGVWYGKYYDDVPDLQLSADSLGRVLLGRCPFSETGTIEHTYGHSNSVAIVRVAQGGKLGFGFLEMSQFNLKFWIGDTSLADYAMNVNMVGTGEVAQGNDRIPREFSLGQNYPNPFNPISEIGFQIAERGHVTLKVYDLLGQEVVTLVDELKVPGVYSTSFDASGLASGVYVYRMQAGDFAATRKMVLLR